MQNFKLISTCSAIALLLTLNTYAIAQQPKNLPRKQPAAKPAAKKAVTPPAPKPAAARPAPKPADSAPPAAPHPKADVPPATPDKDAAKAGPAGPADVPKTETNPAVLSALEMSRTKPADYVESILLLVDLGRPELAKPIIADLAKLEITDAQRQEIVDQFGAADMLKLSHVKELAPEGTKFAEACMAASSAITNNPERIATLIGQLSDPSPETRLLAQHDLAATGPKAATATLEAFAKESDRNRRAALASGIAGMHPMADRMLLAMLDTHDAALRADVADLLRQLQVPQAQPLVTASNDVAEHELASALSSYERGMPVFMADADNQVELWQWNDATKQLSSVRVPAAEARIVWMSKLARMLSQLQPGNPEYQRRALILAWEAESSKQTSQNWPVNPKFIEQQDTQFLSDVLVESLKNNHPHAAVSAIDALAKRRDPSVLITADGKPSPMVNALASPNRNVRFAALSAIMALDPTAPYPGSSRVPEALAWFAGGSAESRALVAMPTNAGATNLAGQLASQKFTAEAANSGHDLMTLARETTDVDAIFVDMDILLPQIREVIYELRMNPATGEVPIALMATEGRLEAAKKLAEEHQRVVAVPRPHSDEVLTGVVKQLSALNDRDVVPANERMAQATQAKAWLAKLESGSRPFYAIRRMARLAPAPPHREAPENLPKP